MNKLPMEFTLSDMDMFLTTIYDENYYTNNGGMASPDMFTLFICLKTLKPKVVIESGVWNGLSTKLIRKILGNDIIIICLDPRPVPNSGYIDINSNTIYYTGNKFIDFKNLCLDHYNSIDILAFFDDHQNAVERLIQCKNKNIKNIFFNDNYPKKCGSHYTLEHLINDDTRLANYRNKDEILSMINNYYIFPNIFPGIIKTGEGYFNCSSFLTEKDNNNSKYTIFKKDQPKYRWNTYIALN